ncbi:ATP-dependent zinc protease [Candidatus Dojkabacteria bacterium]|uniref:ATP-dependent zinc protease n=1 Tax=Candidatus Dojkabacteria bacterium TaxID=2099670 RepID=A0A955L0B1_9BACT|nr:ATP-dependent zinc protease [Candidatus Dojkabacteria bacterium]
MIDLLRRIGKNRKTVLGLNERYLEYIRPYNLSPAIEIADDKVLTKEVLSAHDIPVPETIAVIRSYDDLNHIDFDAFPSSFVIKPVHGVRGGGVEIIYNRDKNGEWIMSRGRRIDLEGIKSLCRDIIDGRYSLHQERDTVLVEERIKSHKAFRYYSYKGTPDVRVIVFNNIPVIGMLRLPTEQSDGRANLDLGAIGAGIDMAVGKTTFAISGKSGLIEKTPKYNLPVSGLRIPYWTKILRYSIEASKVSGLGFATIDFLIDKEKGPMIVELNARPGISIQLANQVGLRARLKKAAGIKVKTTEKGIRLAKDLFGGEIEEGIEAISGKQVIGLIENVKIFGKDEKEEVTKAKIDTGASSTSIDEKLAIKLGYEDAINHARSILGESKVYFSRDEIKKDANEQKWEERLEEHPDIVDTAIIKQSNGITYRITVEMEFELSGTRVIGLVNIVSRSGLSYKVLIGKKDLKKFLIDPSKKST